MYLRIMVFVSIEYLNSATVPDTTKQFMSYSFEGNRFWFRRIRTFSLIVSS